MEDFILLIGAVIFGVFIGFLLFYNKPDKQQESQETELFLIWCAYAGFSPVVNTEMRDKDARLSCVEFNFNDVWECDGEQYSTGDLYFKYKEETK